MKLQFVAAISYLPLMPILPIFQVREKVLLKISARFSIFFARSRFS